MAEEKANTLDDVQVDFIDKETGEVKHLTVKKYLDLKPEQISEQELEFYNALWQLYRLNNREPPLFKSFPKRKDGKMLVIDATSLKETKDGTIVAHYKEEENQVAFDNTQEESSLLISLAHELKHAEQCSDELMNAQNGFREKNGLAFHKIRYLMEAQAHAFGDFVEKLQKGEKLDWEEYQKENIPKKLKWLYKSFYKNQFDVEAPIDEKDKGIDASQIPESFHFSDDLKNNLLTELEAAPKETKLEMIFFNLLDVYTDAETEEDKKSKEKEIKGFVKNHKNIQFSDAIKEVFEEVDHLGGRDAVENILKLAVDFSASMDDKTAKKFREDVMLFSAENGHTEVVKKLIDLNDSYKFCCDNKECTTPLMYAARNGHTEIINELLSHGMPALLDATNLDGRTALMEAVLGGHADVVKQLVDVGAKLDIKDIDEKDVFDMAREKGDKEIIEILEMARIKESEKLLKEMNSMLNEQHPESSSVEPPPLPPMLETQQAIQREDKQKMSFGSRILTMFRLKKTEGQEEGVSLLDATDQLMNEKKDAMKNVPMALPQRQTGNQKTSEHTYNATNANKNIITGAKDSGR